MCHGARIDDCHRAGRFGARREQVLHGGCPQLKDLPQVAAAWAIDANGHDLRTGFPGRSQLDNSGREISLRTPESDLHLALRAPSAATSPSPLHRELSAGADGSFRGIVVAVSGPYFASFYNSLLGGSAIYRQCVREDSTILARYRSGHRFRHRPTTHMGAIADKAAAEVIASGAAFSGGGRVAYRGWRPARFASRRADLASSSAMAEAMAGYGAIAIPRRSG
jgi:hypothetical protein